ncbi:MAG: acyl-CoA dehydrogenase family protein [Sphingobium sp.]
MSILYDEGQQAIATEVQRVLDASYASERLKTLLETRGRYDETFWALAREQGWTGIAFPEEHGGLGMGLVELGLVAEACGSVAAGAPFLNSSFGVGHALLNYGDAALTGEWLPKLASGEAIGAVAFAEGADILPTEPTVRIVNGRLHGTKPAVTGGASADVAVVLAAGEHGPVLALVALAQDGVDRDVLETFDNSRGAADLRFDGAEATAFENMGDALAAALDVLRRQAVVTAHEQVGGARRMMEAARDYALTRRAFGQPIGAFQSIKHRISENYVLVELARANAIHAAASADDAVEFPRAAAAARLMATDAYDTVSRDATQSHGGIGVTWEADLHLHQRRARSLAIEHGNMMFWEDALVEELEGAA